MKSRNLSRHLAAGLLLGAAALGLAGCSLPWTGPQEGSGEWNTLFQVHPLEGFEQADGSFQVRDASGQTVAVMAADDALRDYPARSPVEEGEEKAFPRTLWGTAPDGTQWAVTWSGPSAGVSQCRALLSRDVGETWTLTPSYPSLVSDVYGAGFLSEQVGFVCSRHFLTSGPEVLWTRDGGSTWELLDLQIPEAYQGRVMDAYSPRIQDGAVCFPVLVWGDGGQEDQYIFCSSTDLEHWIWSEVAPDWVSET